MKNHLGGSNHKQRDAAENESAACYILALELCAKVTNEGRPEGIGETSNSKAETDLSFANPVSDDNVRGKDGLIEHHKNHGEHCRDDCSHGTNIS